MQWFLKISQIFCCALLFYGVVACDSIAQKKKGSSESATSETTYTNNPILATVEGKSVYFSDIQNKPLHDLASQMHRGIEQELKAYAVGLLIDKHKELQDAVEKPVEEKDIVEFYTKNKLHSRGTLDKLKPRIRELLEHQSKQEKVQAQYDLAVGKGWIKNYVMPPEDFVVVAKTKTAFIRGNAEAKVMFLEFSDYQCPFCQRVQGSINNLIETYGDRVAFGYRHYPLSFHTEADEAAVAAECAREQGQFEKMHDHLFNNQRKQHIKDLKAYARELKIPDLQKFDQCLDADKYREIVNIDLKDGAALGINGTPGFIIGTYDPKTQTLKGETVSGALPQSQFETLIKKYLEKG